MDYKRVYYGIYCRGKRVQALLYIIHTHKTLGPFSFSFFRIKAILIVLIVFVLLAFFFPSAEDVNREEAGGLYFMPLRPKHCIGE